MSMLKAAQMSSATLGVALVLSKSMTCGGVHNKEDGGTYCCGQAQYSFGLDLFCKPRN